VQPLGQVLLALGRLGELVVAARELALEHLDLQHGVVALGEERLRATVDGVGRGVVK